VVWGCYAKQREAITQGIGIEFDQLEAGRLAGIAYHFGVFIETIEFLC